MLFNKKGFTLIEMVIVLVVLGLIASFAVARMIDAKDEVKVKAVTNDLVRQLNALESQCFSKALLIHDGDFPNSNAEDTFTLCGSDFEALFNDGVKYVAASYLGTGQELIDGIDVSFLGGTAATINRVAGDATTASYWQ